MEISVRAVGAEDRELLLRVYASTRQEALARVNWSVDREARFLERQFEVQERYVREHYPAADHHVILRGGEPVGRLSVDRGGEVIHVIDLALLPRHRGAGIGTLLLERICAEADAGAKRATIRMEVESRARRLYERLGFRALDDRAVYLTMERAARGAASEAETAVNG